MSAFPSAPHQSDYEIPPLGWSAAGLDHPAMDSPTGSPSNPDTAVEQAVQQLLDALGVDEGEHTAQTPARGTGMARDVVGI